VITVTAKEKIMDTLFSSVGEMREVFTMVDYYQYIKGVEYLICVAFFVGFPMYYRYINSKEEAGTPKGR
jgi:hypothetical protein